MKVAVPTNGPSLHSAVELEFGRNPYFLIIDLDTLGFDFVSNGKKDMPINAALLCVPLLTEQGVDVVLTGKCPTPALHMLVAAGIEVFTGARGLVRQTVEEFRCGKLACVRPTECFADSSRPHCAICRIYPGA